MTMEEELEAAEEERWCMVVCHHHHQHHHPRHFSPDENISLTQSKKLSYIAGCGLNSKPFTLSIAIKVKFLERACSQLPISAAAAFNSISLQVSHLQQRQKSFVDRASCCLWEKTHTYIHIYIYMVNWKRCLPYY
jgi:hypothetical protein